ncbi:MAG: exodeoxyribonuclease VII small subunit [Clostridia bacterium]|nr:exodeoxyribonuclease VII small subunit [Clostridia bacterium]
MAIKPKEFEENLKALSDVVKKLEGNEISLTEAISAFEDGIGLYKACRKFLDEADEKIKILVESNELGELIEEDL